MIGIPIFPFGGNLQKTVQLHTCVSDCRSHICALHHDGIISLESVRIIFDMYRLMFIFIQYIVFIFLYQFIILCMSSDLDDISHYYYLKYCKICFSFLYKIMSLLYLE